MKIVSKMKCEHCGCPIYIDESQLGGTVGCPSCGFVYSVEPEKAASDCVQMNQPTHETETEPESEPLSKRLAVQTAPETPREPVRPANGNPRLKECAICGEPMAKTAPTCPNCGARNHLFVDRTSCPKGFDFSLALVLGTVGLFLGLLVGYGIFGEIQGNYVPIEFIFSTKTGLLEGFMSSLCRLPEMREKILVCGVAGAVLGLILGMIGSVRK